MRIFVFCDECESMEIHALKKNGYWYFECSICKAAIPVEFDEDIGSYFEIEV